MKSTMKNENGSSRSFVVLKIKIKDTINDKIEGELKIIDLAGSEWIKYDQSGHDV